jgi:hypothetical protein
MLVVAAVPVVFAVLPRRWWDFSRTHELDDAVSVTRTTSVYRLGLPFECIDVRRHDWSATQRGNAFTLGSRETSAFAALELELRQSMMRCRHESGLSRKAALRGEAVLQADTLASACVVQWRTLLANAALWLVAGAILAYLRCWLGARQAMRRGRAGRCAQCGYDLAGNVSGVCPECGATI